MKSNHEIIADFWVRTSALLFASGIACAYGRHILSFLALLALAAISAYRGWLAEHGDKDEPVPLKTQLEHLGTIWFTGIIGFPFIIIAYPFTIYQYVKARRSPYY